MSNVLAVTVTVFSIGLLLSVRLAWIVTVTLSPATSVPNPQVTVFPPWHAPRVVMTEV